MNLRRFSIATCLFLLAIPSSADNFLKKLACGERPVEINVTTRHGDPEILLGPSSLTFSHLNRLRYEISLKGKTTFTDGPDLKLAGFIPTLPSPPEAPEEVPDDPDDGTSGESAPEEALEDAISEANVIRGKLEELLERAQESSDALQADLDDLARLVGQSDSLIATDAGAQSLVDEIQRMVKRIEDDLAKWKWPSNTEIGRLRADVRKTQESLEDMEEDVAKEGNASVSQLQPHRDRRSKSV